MLFNTVAYGVFFVVVLAAFWLVRRHRTARNLSLLAASYFFYGSWNVNYLVLILISTLLDFWVGRALGRETHAGRRRMLLAASLIGNLGLLATFKYYGFFAESLQALLESVGISANLPALEVLLPVGISFYTFQTLSYTIDIYRGRLQPTHKPLDFALFVAFFPQLVAGPIVRAAHFLPQLERDPRSSTAGDRRMSDGLFLIIKGLFKKIVIADFLAVSIVDKVYADPTAFGGVDLLLATYAYALQIYGDFSGYSDIAIGSAKLLGFDIPKNFNAPYLARNLRDFWRRWHISLSTWLRDYLYIPLGGSRGGGGRTYVALAVTMLLGGLWHGAAWRFIAWGALHGVGLALTRLAQRAGLRLPTGPIVSFAQGLLTFHFVCAGWVFFRAVSFDHAVEVFRGLARASGAPTLATLPVLLVMAVGFTTHLLPRQIEVRTADLFARLPVVCQAVVLVASLALFDAMALTAHPFIYFQF
ncbi:MAG: MBOAT family protein [Myxococcota bacterium]